MQPEAMSVESLLALYLVDLSHARQVADLSLAIFDAVAARYDLPASQRRLLEIGALLHNVGMTTDPPAHHLVGRDIVLRHPLSELSPREQHMVACMVAFHRKRVRPEQEPAYLALGKRGQQAALQLAAILRVADGLDYCQSQSTSLIELVAADKTLTLYLTGPHAEEDGARAVAKADLWHKLFGERMHAVSMELDQAAPAAITHEASLAAPEDAAPDVPSASPAAIPAAHEGEPPGSSHPNTGAATASEHSDDSTDQADADDEQALLAPWYAEPTAPLAELGRVLLRRHLRRLRAAERAVRADKEIEAVHALRVATRRLRSTLRLLTPVYHGGDLRALSKGVGRIGRAAGAVRDRDVLLADLAARTGQMPPTLSEELVVLKAALNAERQSAHAKLLAFLETERYADFLRCFAKAMNDLSAWDDGPRVRDLGGSTIWRHYEALRAHDRDGLPTEIEALHMMRIDGKRMRYVLELFSDTLGTHADAAVQPLVAVQDHLGILNDIAVAGDLLAPHAHADATGPVVSAYLALREQQATQMLAELPACWQQLADEHYRRTLMELIVRL
jgi:CHAD domain-containing protein